METQLLDNLKLIETDKNTNLLPENLKTGVTCLGVEGTSKSLDVTADATASAGDIVSGETAYVNNEKVTGTMRKISDLFGFGTASIKIHDSYDVWSGELTLTPSGSKAYIEPGVPFKATALLQNTSALAKQMGIKPEVIGEGNKILNVTGTAKICDTTDATAVHSDILNGKTAYVNGKKVTGSLIVDQGDIQSAEFIAPTAISFQYATESSFSFENINTSNTTTMDYLFYKCKNLTTIDFIGLDLSNVKSMKYAFANMDALETIDLSTLDTSNVEFMDNLFYGSAIKSIDLSKLDTTSCTSLTYLLGHCSNLENIDIEGFSLGKATSLNSAFYYCKALKSLDLSSLNVSNVTDMSSIVRGCSGLTDLKLPEATEGLELSLSNAFEGCSSLTTLDLSSLSKYTVKSASSLCANCTLLESITFGDFTLSQSVFSSYSHSNMFKNCPALSDDALNAIMKLVSVYTSKIPTSLSRKTLKYIGLSEEQAAKCVTLSNWALLEETSWTTGY